MRVPLPVIASLCMTTSLVLADDEVTRAKSPSQSPRLAVQHAEFFEARIRPILSEYCVSCHGPRKQQSGLRLDSQGREIPKGHRWRASRGTRTAG